MKKTIAIAAGLTCLALSPAFAQSSVTLYGIMDAGVAYIDNKGGPSSTELRSGNLFSSRFGFRGKEDLGGGLNAIFNIEAGLSADTGASSTPYFNRQSWMGLQSSSFGSITMGRMMPTISDLVVTTIHPTHFGNAAAALDGAALHKDTAAGRFNNMLGGTRVDNAIKYQSPSFSGFKVHAMTAFGEVSGSNSAGRILSLGGTYTSANIEAGLGYHERECTDAGGCAAGKAKDKIAVLGAAYKLNGARYGVVYTRQENALNVQGNDADVISLIARVPFNQWTIGGGVQYLNDRTTANQDVRQINLGVNYDLSKRTQIYTLYSHQSVKNGGKAGMYATISDNSKQNQFSLGIVHRF